MHIGIYAFRREVLLKLAENPGGRLGKGESLEQLRAVEAGEKIRAVPWSGLSVGVDRPEDIRRVETLMDPGEGGS